MFGFGEQMFARLAYWLSAWKVALAWRVRISTKAFAFTFAEISLMFSSPTKGVNKAVVLFGNQSSGRKIVNPKQLLWKPHLRPYTQTVDRANTIYVYGSNFKESMDFIYNPSLLLITLKVIFRGYTCLSRHPRFLVKTL